jgi:hypothetical protein
MLHPPWKISLLTSPLGCQPSVSIQPPAHPTMGRGQPQDPQVGCPRNEKNNFSVRTETNRNKICFGFVSVCFVKQKNNNFRLFRFVSVFRTHIETTETNRIVSKRTETTRNCLKKTQKMISLKLQLKVLNK